MLVTKADFLRNVAMAIDSIIADDGGTIVDMLYTPSTGYIVGGNGKGEQHFDMLVQSFPTINEMLRKGYNVGLWREEGRWVLDAVSVHYSLSSAVDAAKERGERAFYDITNESVIMTDEA